ncbi:MAG: GAF domain-containing sensor histidine kinase [Nibricoccus sp.]
MMITNHEEKRLEALEETALLDSAAEDAFDRLTSFAATALDVPLSLITLVARDRQFFKSQYGMADPRTREGPLSHSFCKHVVRSGDPLIVEDARLHAVLKTNPAVKELPVIAYAGVPLINSEGYCLGSLCAVDHKPRKWSSNDVGLLRGLAAQTMTEIELRRRNRQIGEKLESVHRQEIDRQTMVRLTIHDLRTPLSSLMLSMDMISSLGALSVQQRDMLTLSQRSAQVLKTLVDDLLDYEAIGQTGVEALSYQNCDPYALCSSAMDQVRSLATSKRIALEKQLDLELPSFEGDQRKLSRVLVNLLGNAIKFTPTGGFVRLNASAGESPKTICFRITDTGIGFDPKHAKAIFEAGVRLDKNASTQQSTGFGLAFCKRVIDAHSGRIEVNSEPGKGSSFMVTLPYSRPRP